MRCCGVDAVRGCDVVIVGSWDDDGWECVGRLGWMLNQVSLSLPKDELCGAKLPKVPPKPMQHCLYHVCGIDKIVKVQSKFTESLQGTRFISYLDRLELLNTKNLKLRRNRKTSLYLFVKFSII